MGQVQRLGAAAESVGPTVNVRGICVPVPAYDVLAFTVMLCLHWPHDRVLLQVIPTVAEVLYIKTLLPEL